MTLSPSVQTDDLKGCNVFTAAKVKITLDQCLQTAEVLIHDDKNDDTFTVSNC